MRIFHLMQVESSLARSVSTDSSRMSPYSSEYGTYFTIKSLILIGEFTFLALVQSRLTCVDLSFSPRAMTLKTFFSSCQFIRDGCSSRGTQVVQLLRGCTTVVYVYSLCVLGGLCVRIRIFRVKRLFVRVQRVRFKRRMRTNTSFARKVEFAYVYGLCARISLCVRIHLCA